MSDRVQDAVNLAKKGDRAGARKILTDELRKNPNNSRAWYLLGQLVDSPEQAVKCLERALELQPDNPQIKAKLDELISQQPLPELNLPPASRPVPYVEKQPKKKTAWWIYALLAVALPVLLCMCFGALFLDSSTGDTSGDGGISNPFKTTHTIVYRVEGSASSALISYNNDQGGTEQVNSARLPWRKTYEMSNGAMTSLVAQSDDTARTITCIIDLDGKEWKRSSSSGDYVVVTCTGWIGME